MLAEILVRLQPREWTRVWFVERNGYLYLQIPKGSEKKWTQLTSKYQ